ncbi:subtilisin-like serine protease, putative [Babesia ovis]|uniref:Subtilisin-like serine protease, putative n=1 Tax=Babesia ovis TaxID=5869 RepID=A0A9W5WUX1_BABOV|nr:subtilisin-like serine protease, putative [Babesia ovis]
MCTNSLGPRESSWEALDETASSGLGWILTLSGDAWADTTKSVVLSLLCKPGKTSVWPSGCTEAMDRPNAAASSNIDAVSKSQQSTAAPMQTSTASAMSSRIRRKVSQAFTSPEWNIPYARSNTAAGLQDAGENTFSEQSETILKNSTRVWVNSLIPPPTSEVIQQGLVEKLVVIKSSFDLVPSINLMPLATGVEVLLPGKLVAEEVLSPVIVVLPGKPVVLPVPVSLATVVLLPVSTSKPSTSPTVLTPPLIPIANAKTPLPTTYKLPVGSTLPCHNICTPPL